LGARTNPIHYDLLIPISSQAISVCFGTEPLPGSLQEGALHLCRGSWHWKNWQNSTDL